MANQVFTGICKDYRRNFPGFRLISVRMSLSHFFERALPGKNRRGTLRNRLNTLAIGACLFLSQPGSRAAIAEEKPSKHPKRHAAEAFFSETNIPVLRITIP